MLEQIHELTHEIRDYEIQLGVAADDNTPLLEDAARRRAEYDLAYAKAILLESAKIGVDGKKPTVPVIEASALLAVEKEMFAARLAEALAEASRARLKSLQAGLSGVQSRARLFETEANLAKHKV